MPVDRSARSRLPTIVATMARIESPALDAIMAARRPFDYD